MNENKNFVRLDDVFNRLRDGEEAYQPAAWEQMRDILDKRMPVGGRRPSGRGNKWLFFSLFGILLIAGAGFLTYSLVHKPPHNVLSANNSLTNEPPTATVAEANQIAPNPENSSSASNLNKQQKTTPSNALKMTSTGNSPHHLTKDAASAHLNREGKVVKHDQVKSDLVTSKSNAPASVGPQRAGITSIASNPVEHDLHPNRPRLKGNDAPTAFLKSETINVNALDLGALTLFPIKEERKTFEELTLNPFFRTQQSDLTPIVRETVVPVTNPTENQDAALAVLSSSSADEIQAGTNSLKKSQGKIKDKLYMDQNGGIYKETRDTFNRVEVTARTVAVLDNRHKKESADRIILDTTARYKVVRQIFTPLAMSGLTKMSAKVAPPVLRTVPASSTTIRSESGAPDKSLGTYVYLSDYLVATKTSVNQKSGLARFFQDMGDQLNKWFNGHRSWYMAIIAGGNTGIDGNGNYGLQVGVDLFYDIAERWTLSAGLRYKNGFLPNYKFEDNSVNYDVSGMQQSDGYLFSGTRTESDRIYNITRLSQIQLPLNLKYCLGRVSLFGGPVFSYFLPMKYNQTEQSSSMTVSRLVPGNQNPFADAPYRVNPVRAFDTRLGIGYDAGLQYDFSRKFSMELRVNQIFLDNFSGYSPKALQKIYHQPSLELNMGFYFGRKEKVLYMMKHN